MTGVKLTARQARLLALLAAGALTIAELKRLLEDPDR
jgi:DNA-binding CsgD family transcriptional regulator